MRSLALRWRQGHTWLPSSRSRTTTIAWTCALARIHEFQDEGVTNSTCPAKILGFVRYNITKGIPTPQFSGNEELSLDTIRDNDIIDNNVYVVVHTASDYVLMDQLQSDFITSFSLGNISECVYIVNIDTIQGPLFVFKNYGSVGEDTNKCFCSIPQEKWGQYFSDRIYWCYPTTYFLFL